MSVSVSVSMMSDVVEARVRVRGAVRWCKIK
jgi:hypothetical protein